MSEIKTRPRFLRILPYFLFAALVGFLVFYHAGRLAVFYADHFTECSVTYEEWRGTVFNGAEIRGMRLELPGKVFAARGEKCFFKIDTHRLLTRRQIVLDCKMEGVSFSRENNKESLSFYDDVLMIPFSSELEYGDVSFVITARSGVLEISDLRADSKNVRMSGSYVHFRGSGEVRLELKISFSPDMAADFDDAIKENVLSPDEDGWYSTVISYRGNALLLKALYA
ncbi:MAG: hypothetical protein ABIH74_02540 [Candidatus Omnitrophota bacterium]